MITSFDVDTQAKLSSIYLELCQQIDAKLSLRELDLAREAIGTRLLSLAQEGERDEFVLRQKTAAYFDLRQDA